MTCRACGRPAATARASCLYCGAALARPTEAAPPPDPARPGALRTLLVLDLARADAAKLTRALGLSPFDAHQWLRRGGCRLHRIAPREDAEREASRLGALGLEVVRLAEAGVRAAVRPRIALSGAWNTGALEARSAEGPVRIAAEDVLIVVKGPIARDRVAEDNPKRLRTASPEPGYRIHLHRSEDPRPVELDPDVFALGRGTQASALLQLAEWAEALGRGRPLDDSFRHMAPELAQAEPGEEGASVAAAALAPRRPRRGAPVLLDNVAQFRFYSAWRAALERRDAASLR